MRKKGNKQYKGQQQQKMKKYAGLLIDFVGKHGSIVDAVGALQFKIVQTRVHDVLLGHCAQTLFEKHEISF
jgi:hypothetical protein